MDHFYLKLCKCLILSSLKDMVEVNFTRVDVVLAYTAKKLQHLLAAYTVQLICSNNLFYELRKDRLSLGCSAAHIGILSQSLSCCYLS